MSFDGFKGHQMELVEDSYVSSQMVPPGPLEYYYTVESERIFFALTDDQRNFRETEVTTLGKEIINV
jgi:hypothetical protein